MPLLLRQARGRDDAELAVAQQLLLEEASWHVMTACSARVVRAFGHTRVVNAFALVTEFANGGDLDSHILGKWCASFLLSLAGIAGCTDSPSA